DQALAFGGGTLAADEVASILGTADREAIYDLLEALAENRADALWNKLTEVTRGANDPDDVLDAVIETFALLARQQLLPAVPPPADVPPERLKKLAESFAPETVQLNYDIALAGKRDLDRAPDPALALEMILLRMLVFRPDESPVAESELSPPRAARQRSAQAPRNKAGATASAQTATPAPDEDWEALLDRLELDGLTRELAQQCRLVAREDNRIRLELDERRKQLLTPRLEKSLRSALAREFGDSLRLAINVARHAGKDTPAGKRSARAAQRQAQAEEAIASDPHVAALRETFGAEVIPDTIRPEE
ncbi:MAG: DNA polymerase III subunit gamma/tau C-terminal domain-containing protein, partial [Gammaproteobacteria bacterium]